MIIVKRFSECYLKYIWVSDNRQSEVLVTSKGCPHIDNWAIHELWLMLNVLCIFDKYLQIFWRKHRSNFSALFDVALFAEEIYLVKNSNANVQRIWFQLPGSTTLISLDYVGSGWHKSWGILKTWLDPEFYP